MQSITFKRLLPFVILLLVVIISVISFRACSPFLRATETPTPTLSNTPSPTSSPQPTATDTLTPTLSPSPTLSPTPAYTAVVTALILNARSGPATTYQIMAELPLDTVLTVLARSTDSEWFFIILPESAGNAWVWKGGLSYDFDVNLLPDYFATPTHTPTSTQATSYGSAILAPPNLPGIAPSASGNPARGLLSLITFGLLSSIAIFSKASSPRTRHLSMKSSLSRLVQLISSLF